MMKQLLVALCLVISVNALAQRVLEEKVTFTDTRLPLFPLGDDLAGYTFKVSTPYPENNDDLVSFAKEKYENDVANYDDTVAESKAQHERDLETYEEEVLMARENFKLESAEFKKLSLVERLALSDQKPTLKLPRKPVYRKPGEPYYTAPNLSNSIVFDPAVLSKSIQLDGYEIATENALEGVITFYDFEFLDPEQKTRDASYVDSKTRKTVKKTERYYVYSYKRPTELTLSYNGEVLHNGFYDGTDEFISSEAKSRPNMKNIEKQTINNIMADIGDFLNSDYGKSQLDNTVAIKYVKNKKGEYDDLESALEYAISGFDNFNFGEDNDDLEEALAIWEEALEASDLEDRKARIDTKVTKAILFNIVEVALALNQIDKAEGAFKQLGDLKLNYSEKQDIESLEFYLKDKKARLEANE